MPGYEAGLWYGLWGPRNLRRDAVEVWNREVRKAFQAPDIRERFAAEGMEATDGAPELLLDTVSRDVEKWRKVVKAANINVQE